MDLTFIDDITVPLPAGTPVTWPPPRDRKKGGPEFYIYPTTFRIQARLSQELIVLKAQETSEAELHKVSLEAIQTVVKPEERAQCAAILEAYTAYLEHPKRLDKEEAVALVGEAASIRSQLTQHYQPLQELMGRNLIIRQMTRFLVVKHHLAGWNDKVKVAQGGTRKVPLKWETKDGLVKEEVLNRVDHEDINGMADFINNGLVYPSEDLEKNSDSQSPSRSSQKRTTAGKYRQTKGQAGKSSKPSTRKTRASKSGKT